MQDYSCIKVGGLLGEDQMALRRILGMQMEQFHILVIGAHPHHFHILAIGAHLAISVSSSLYLRIRFSQSSWLDLEHPHQLQILAIGGVLHQISSTSLQLEQFHRIYLHIFHEREINVGASETAMHFSQLLQISRIWISYFFYHMEQELGIVT